MLKIFTILLFLSIGISAQTVNAISKTDSLQSEMDSIKKNYNYSKWNLRLNSVLNKTDLEELIPFLDYNIPAKLSFNFVGDIMCHGTQYRFAQVGPDSFNFKPVYREVKDFLSSTDFTIGNLETVMAGKERGYKGYPLFNTPDDFLEGLKYAGFDILVTANNHTLDRGVSGLKRTIDRINDYGMVHNGSYKTQNEKDEIKLFKKNGISFTLLSFTYGSNHYQNIQENINIISDTLLIKKVKLAKSLNPDFLIVYFHFGTEYKKLPSSYQERVVDLTAELGADLIIASHPHVLQPVGLYYSESNNVDTSYVAYSLGNFVSNQRWRYSDGGAILNFEFEKNKLNNSKRISQFNYLPIWVYKGNTNLGNEYIVYPSEIALTENLPEFFTDRDKDLMLECYYDTNEIMTKFTDKVKKIGLNKLNSLINKK